MWYSSTEDFRQSLVEAKGFVPLYASVKQLLGVGNFSLDEGALLGLESGVIPGEGLSWEPSVGNNPSS